MMKAKKINEFRGDYFFLSNFCHAEINYQGKTYWNNESAFQAMKCPQRADEFQELGPREAKRLGRSVKLRSDWTKVKEQIMYEICLAKFIQHPDLREKLLNTGDAELEEGNNWNDTEWGVCNGVGENKLGKILMRVREDLSGKRETQNIYNEREENRKKGFELDMLEGNICRLSICETKEEAYYQYYYITMRAQKVLEMTLKRLDHEEAVKKLKNE